MLFPHINIFVSRERYIYMLASYSCPNEWANLAEIFKGTLEYSGGKIG